MLQQDEPDDYVVATGETHSIEELVERAFAEVGIDDWRRYVRQDPKFFRPAEVDLLIGDATKARSELGWEPEVDFPTLVKMMVAHDLALEAAKAGIRRPTRDAGPDWSGLERHVGDRLDHRVGVGDGAARQPVAQGEGERHIAATDDDEQPDLDPAEHVVAGQPVASRNATTPTAHPRATRAWPLQGDHRLGEGERDHVAGAAEGEHRQRAPAQVGVVHDSITNGPSTSAPSVPTTPTASTTISRRRSPARNSSSSPRAASRLRRGSRAACTAWNRNSGMRASSTP